MLHVDMVRWAVRCTGTGCRHYIIYSVSYYVIFYLFVCHGKNALEQTRLDASDETLCKVIFQQPILASREGAGEGLAKTQGPYDRFYFWLVWRIHGYIKVGKWKVVWEDVERGVFLGDV
ncbi:uncharacterized protein BDR25DRAFT_356544 [Lindgomyces ingoldianus]|uniref:Uncharacterized protein n=1 Tax=Lindgomyces ingoldianus TaxID=673940 RepID=A0ACB6QSN1_9PLEO|nr:uncharacterized protein BDR25DRAFT_356544 [Lindgomyces ingoldianus]KAF2469302.1 hypothetical protein BDR25DRAFT_356544 [Lindgomyces ingoldianus]